MPVGSPAHRSASPPVRAHPAAPWEPMYADRLLPEHIDGMLRQEIAYVLIRGLLSPEWCEEISRRFVAFIAAHPEHHVFLRTNYVDAVVLGMNFFMRGDADDGPSRLDEYFARVPVDRPRLRDLYRGGADPLDLVRAFWQQTGYRELPAEEGGAPYHTDVLWGMVGPAMAPPHVDTYHQEAACSLSRFPRRFSCNTFIQRPERGGNFRVYRQRQNDGDFSRDRPPPCAEYVVSPGDLLIFDAGHYHEVLPVEGDRHRLFSHMAVLLDPASREYSMIA